MESQQPLGQLGKSQCDFLICSKKSRTLTSSFSDDEIKDPSPSTPVSATDPQGELPLIERSVAPWSGGLMLDQTSLPKGEGAVQPTADTDAKWSPSNASGSLQRSSDEEALYESDDPGASFLRPEPMNPERTTPSFNFRLLESN